MLIDISNLRMQPGLSEEHELSSKLENVVYGDERIEFTSPVWVKLKLLNVGKAIEVEGEAKTSIRLKCARCLTPINYQLQTELRGEFRERKNMALSDSEAEQEEDVYYYTGNSINISKMLVENILLAYPMKALCEEDCKGLCPICGTNLNVEQCHCKVDDIDPRLAVLEKLIKAD